MLLMTMMMMMMLMFSSSVPPPMSLSLAPNGVPTPCWVEYVM
jgi:hypothetical protein